MTDDRSNRPVISTDSADVNGRDKELLREQFTIQKGPSYVKVTPTEAGAVATAYGFFVGFVVYRELKLSALPKICYKVLVSTATVMYLMSLASAYVLS